MDNMTRLAILLVATLHLLFLVLEMLLWNTTLGRRIFRMSRARAEQTTVLAANQGLYNGFLAAGLLWGLSDPAPHHDMIVFLLCCVIAAGVFGAVTANRAILWIQALPGVVALGLVLRSGA
ncbi:MAG: DUF1304 domain-containing protein [Pseudomonadota bacterium]